MTGCEKKILSFQTICPVQPTNSHLSLPSNYSIICMNTSAHGISFARGSPHHSISHLLRYSFKNKNKQTNKQILFFEARQQNVISSVNLRDRPLGFLSQLSCSLAV